MSNKRLQFSANPKQIKPTSYSHEIHSYFYKNITQEASQQLYQKHQEMSVFDGYIKSNSCLKRLYNLVIDNMNYQSYKDAIFFADKLLTLTNNHSAVVYLLGECYYHNSDFKKVHTLFQKHKLLNYNLNFQILAGRALLKNKLYELCLNVLELAVESDSQNPKQEAVKFFLRGQCHEANENKLYAVSCYVECLKKDPTYIEAFNRLVDCYLLTYTEKEQLLSLLNFNPEDIWIKKYYISRIKEDLLTEKKPTTFRTLDLNSSASGNEMQDSLNRQSALSSRRSGLLSNLLPTQGQSQAFMQNTMNEEQPTLQEEIYDPLLVKPDNIFEILNSKNNIDILCIKVKNAISKYEIDRAYEICIRAIKEDPLYFDVIPYYCVCLLEMNNISELYYCAHNLVENYATHPLSWFAVGVYYFLIKKYEVARKYFQKANMLDRSFTFSWIGFAHSFAVQDESDQAMSVYRTCSRLFPGCYLAQLYIGMEYLRTNNLKTAILSFQHAKDINPNDPLIYNEIGVIYFKQKLYNDAKDVFLHAINLCNNATNSILETIYSNLAHSYRKLSDFKNAVKYYEKCISLNQKNPQIYFALAYTYHISNQLNKAISFYHKSLFYKYDNPFAHDMLSRCLSDAAENPLESVYDV